jgi:hypothetical protein
VPGPGRNNDGSGFTIPNESSSGLRNSRSIAVLAKSANTDRSKEMLVAHISAKDARHDFGELTDLARAYERAKMCG